ncbi:hypothetical protein D1007_20842 [Hordeum vulgare]|nr:hypothetical protein D1007_20842 [Hordeum vulgare]
MTTPTVPSFAYGETCRKGPSRPRVGYVYSFRFLCCQQGSVFIFPSSFMLTFSGGLVEDGLTNQILYSGVVYMDSIMGASNNSACTLMFDLWSPVCIPMNLFILSAYVRILFILPPTQEPLCLRAPSPCLSPWMCHYL